MTRLTAQFNELSRRVLAVEAALLRRRQADLAILLRTVQVRWRRRRRDGAAVH